LNAGREAAAGNDVDVELIIVGGGLVGSVLALAMQSLPLRCALIEARDPRVLAQPSFDDRSTALAEGSRRILDALGLWPQLAAMAEPITCIHVCERGRFGATRLRADDHGVAALGHTVENRLVGQVVWDALSKVPQLTTLAPARVLAVDTDIQAVSVDVDTGNGTERIRGRLLVAADGADSPLRAALGIKAREDDYQQSAVVLNCTTEKPHRGMAFERFTGDGPLAMLPLGRGRMSVVWTCRADDARQLMQLDDEAFRSRLQRAFGYRLGRIRQCGVRSVHPLRRVVSDQVTGHRAVLIGNAAASLHPVAGQGFNLALRDVATLADALAHALRVDAADPGSAGRVDIGADHVLSRYQSARAEDRRRVVSLTHGLVNVFGCMLPGAGMVRGLTLSAFDRFPPLKNMLAEQMMGLKGRQPALARGLPVGSR
jgi:2-octaprenyl-6-methoxyphenol hydroxylase